MPRFRVIVDTGFVGAKHYGEVSVGDEEWAAMDEPERQRVLNELCEEVVWNHIGAHAEEIVNE